MLNKKATRDKARHIGFDHDEEASGGFWVVGLEMAHNVSFCLWKVMVWKLQ